MKLSNNTLSVLKNFGVINQGILFKQGKTVRTVSPQKNILAEANIEEKFSKEFGIYDLNNFLSVVSLHKDDPSFDFGEKDVAIVGNNGRSKIKYRFCDPSMLIIPPEKNITLPNPEIEFELSVDDFDWIMRAAAVLSSPQIAVESDGKTMSIVTLDLQNDSANTDSLEISEGDGSVYRMVFKTENISKLMRGSYNIKISSKGISQFQNKDVDLIYWISTESSSKFGK